MKVVIRPVLNGWRVQCGCQEVVFDDRTKLVQELDEYLRDPESVEKRYLGTAVNRTLAVPVPPEAAVDCATEAPRPRVVEARHEVRSRQSQI